VRAFCVSIVEISDAAERLFRNWEELGFHDAPRRVVSLVPSVTESLFGLGCGGALVGVTDFCVHPAEAVKRLPRVGGTKNPDLQRIQAAMPDLIIANQEENSQASLAALAAEGFRVWLTFPRTVRQALDLLHDLVRLFRVSAMGHQLSALETAYEWASLAAENTPPVKVFCPIWREPGAHPPAEGPRWWMTIHRDTYVHDVIRLCGGRNVFADRERRYPLAADLGESQAATPGPAAGRDTRYPRVTTQEVAEQAPDLILLPSEPYLFSESDLAAFDDFGEIPAVKNKNIRLVDGSLLTWHGIRVARALAELPAIINPGEAGTENVAWE